MKRNSATQLLCLLSEEELRKFSKFLRSPYFNNTPQLIGLFEHLRKRHPDYHADKIQPKNIWKKLYPNKEYSDQKYWWMNFKLRKLIERFITVEELFGNKKEYKKQFVKSLSRRNAHELFEKETISLLSKLDNQDYQDIQSYSESMWLKHDYFFHSLTDKYKNAIYSIENTMEDLDRFYFLAKMRFASEIKNRELIFSKQVPIRLLDEIKTASSIYVSENPAYLLFRTILDLYVTDKGEQAFKSGIELFYLQSNRLSKHDQNEIMLNIRNYGIRQVNKGNYEYTEDLLRLYKLGLQLDLIVDNGRISPASYLNIAQIGWHAKEFDWTEEFINTYDIYLEKAIRTENRMLSLGLLYFEKGEYDRSLDLISNQDFENILSQLVVRSTILKIWYEKYLKDNNLIELLMANLESTEKYFRRKTNISEQRKAAYINFILSVKLLINLVTAGAGQKAISKKMKEYVSRTNLLASKKWLLEKIEQPKY